VIKRDGGCIFRGINAYVFLDGGKIGIAHKLSGFPKCNGHRNDGELILQADHLITRANSATYADTRLIVCVCKGHHGWKKWNEARYNELLREVLSPERVALWDKCHAARYKPTRMYASDWKMELAALKRELATYQ
jgi:hypothetical protein